MKRAPTLRAPADLRTSVLAILPDPPAGNLNLPKIGYGTAKATRNQLPGGFLKFRIHNVAELELLLMHNRKYAAEVAGSVSVKTRRLIVERAAQLNVRVTNAGARLTKQEAQ